MSVAESAYETVFALTGQCRQCYQCGQCVGACPSGFDLQQGPRRIVRLILAGDVEHLLEAEDVWRCSECRACTDACPMEVPVADMMAAVRALQRAHGGPRCAERAAADVADRRLAASPRIDNMAFGVGMAARGYVPKDVVGAAGAAARIVKGMLDRGEPAAGGATEPAAGGAAAPPAAAPRPLYAGCALPQDREAHALTHKVARDLGLPLVEAGEAGCCGHPTRGRVAAKYASDEAVLTACPACDQGLRDCGLATTPLWQVLVEHAERSGRALRAAQPGFVPYVGCLSDRGPALSSLSAAAALAGASVHMSYPSLHAGCCGALGGMYRGATEAVAKLIAFAQTNNAPIVTPCLLCRDNVRSAVRKRGGNTPVYFWPEFFQAAGPAESSQGDPDD
ncbi:MAG: 4Fe-4S dicluster domain-containing protein [Thermoleophilia bacterium]